MEEDAARKLVRDLMLEFAEFTGLAGTAEARRYLWTDAFAVCNFLELFRQTGEERYRRLALALIDQVHRVLGRHRDDDSRTGWLSGSVEEEGGKHPTAAGLRIGKPLPERRPGEPYNERLEWDRDGQYFHYLTKWMHALARVSRTTRDPACLGWAMELAKTAHSHFLHGPPGRRKLSWKMSIDLTFPLVPAMGQHDPLDGFVTFTELAAAARGWTAAQGPDLAAEIAELAEISRSQNWTTEDPLGIGGLLFDACRMSQLLAGGASVDIEILEGALTAAAAGLEAFGIRRPFRLPAEYRLPFRELGLAIGLHGVERMQRVVQEHAAVFDLEPSIPPRIAALRRYLPMAETIEGFWGERESRGGGSWMAHREINTVMLATSLAPEEFLAV